MGRDLAPVWPNQVVLVQGPRSLLAVCLSIAPSTSTVDEEAGEGDDLFDEKLALGLATRYPPTLATAHLGGELEGVHLGEQFVNIILLGILLAPILGYI